MTSAREFIKKWEEREGKKVSGIKYQVSSEEQKKENEQTNTNEFQYIKISKDENHGGEIRAEDVVKEQKRIKARNTGRKVLKHSGTLIFWLSLVLTFIILLPYAGIGSEKRLLEGTGVPTVQVKNEEIEAKVIKEAEALGLDARFSLYVPKINARAKIIENVDMEVQSEYLKALKDGVAHGKGTNFPGHGKNIFLFSHSVSAPEYIKAYNAVFYDLSEMSIGDEVIVYFSGVKYVYSVSQVMTVSPADVSFLTKDFGGETLILQTCDPPGTTLRRLLVIAGLTK